MAELVDEADAPSGEMTLKRLADIALGLELPDACIAGVWGVLEDLAVHAACIRAFAPAPDPQA